MRTVRWCACLPSLVCGLLLLTCALTGCKDGSASKDGSSSRDGSSSKDGHADRGAGDGTLLGDQALPRDGRQSDGATADHGLNPATLWSWCPEADDYVGGSGTWKLRVTETALYCETFDEMRTIGDEQVKKAQLWLVPGEYQLPTPGASAAMRLPMCAKFVQPDAQPLLAGNGEGSLTFRDYPGEQYFLLLLKQPMKTAGDESWTFALRVNGKVQPGQTEIVLDGSHANACAGVPALQASFSLCRGTCEQYDDVRTFDSCHFAGVTEGHHHLVFDGGWVDLYLRKGCSMASTEPALFTWAKGELDGTAFEQHDYWKLIYSPEHHHFTRDAAVLFDSPINGACGLKATALSPFCCLPATSTCEACDSTVAVETVKCDLATIAKRTLTQVSWIQ